MCGDMKFLGMFMMIYGAITCIGIITALIGVPTIIAGIRLRESADSFLNYLKTNDPPTLENALERQSRYFFILKVFAIIGIIALAIYLVIVFFALIAATSRHY